MGNQRVEIIENSTHEIIIIELCQVEERTVDYTFYDEDAKKYETYKTGDLNEIAPDKIRWVRSMCSKEAPIEISYLGQRKEGVPDKGEATFSYSKITIDGYNIPVNEWIDLEIKTASERNMQQYNFEVGYGSNIFLLQRVEEKGTYYVDSYRTNDKGTITNLTIKALGRGKAWLHLYDYDKKMMIEIEIIDVNGREDFNDIKDNFEFWKPNKVGNNTKLNTIAGRILGVIQTVGTVISVLALVIIGIRYMIASVEEKAKYKETMTAYIVGCLLLFAVSNVATIIYNIAIGIF